MGKYRLLQITNQETGKLIEEQLMPLGTITRRVSYSKCDNTFDVSYSGADTITINEAGYYKITYSATLQAANDGNLGLALLVNDESVYEVGETAVTDDIRNLTISYVVRVFNKCNDVATNNPMTIKVKLLASPVAEGKTNLIVERVY